MVTHTQIVIDCRTMIKKDFEIAKSKTSKYLKPPYSSSVENNVTEYFKKLLIQTNIGLKLVETPNSWRKGTAEQIEIQARKIYSLWKCARRDDVARFVKRIEKAIKEKNVLYTAGAMDGVLFAALMNSVKKKTKLEVKGTPLELKPTVAQIPFIPISMAHSVSIFLTRKDGAALALSCKIAAERAKETAKLQAIIKMEELVGG